jgi:hypothetical protein
MQIIPCVVFVQSHVLEANVRKLDIHPQSHVFVSAHIDVQGMMIK